MSLQGAIAIGVTHIRIWNLINLFYRKRDPVLAKQVNVNLFGQCATWCLRACYVWSPFRNPRCQINYQLLFILFRIFLLIFTPNFQDYSKILDIIIFIRKDLLEMKLNLKFIKLKDRFNAFFVAKFPVIRKKEVFLGQTTLTPYRPSPSSNLDPPWNIFFRCFRWFGAKKKFFFWYKKFFFLENVRKLPRRVRPSSYEKLREVEFLDVFNFFLIF